MKKIYAFLTLAIKTTFVFLETVPIQENCNFTKIQSLEITFKGRKNMIK